MSVQPRISLLTLLMLSSFGSFCAVVLAPALPSIAHFYHVSSGTAEFVMSIFLIGYAVGQFFYGSLSNKYGRKTTLLIGIYIALLGSILAILATFLQSFSLFVIARFISALGSSAGLVMSMILIKDIHDEVNARRTFSRVVLAFAFVPFVAMALGGILTERLGWQTINVAMIFYSVILLITIKFLPETHPKEKRTSFSFTSLLNSYRQLSTNTNYLKLVLLFTMGSTINYVFNAIAPVVIIKSMHISAELYGWLSIIPSIGILLGGWISSRYAARIEPSQMIFYGIILILLCGLVSITLFATNTINLTTFYIIALLMFFGTSLVIPNASMQALAQIKDHANGTSFMNFITLALTSIFVSIAGSFIGFSTLVLPIAITLMALLGMPLIYKYKVYQRCTMRISSSAKNFNHSY